MKPEIHYRILFGLLAGMLLYWAHDELFAFIFIYCNVLWIWLIYLTQISIKSNKSRQDTSIARRGLTIGVIGLILSFLTTMSMFSFLTRMVFGGFGIYTIMAVLIPVIFLLSVSIMTFYLFNKIEIRILNNNKWNLVLSIIFFPVGLVTINIPTRKREVIISP